MSIMDVGYARVSTQQQTLERQIDALTAAGVDPQRIYVDKISGAKNERPGLGALLEYVREGDVVVVASLDRLGRSLTGVLKTVEELRQRGVNLRSLKESIDSTSSVGRMLMGIFATLAEYERELINERACEARAAARARGRQVGRRTKLSAEQMTYLTYLRTTDKTVAEMCALLDISRATYFRYVKGSEAAAGVPRESAA